MKRIYIVMLILLGLNRAGFAQEVTDITEQATEQAEEAPSQPTTTEEVSTEQAVSTETAATTTVEAPPKTKSPFDLSGYFKFYPMAYNYEDNYIGLRPGATIATKVNVMEDKELNLSLSYDLLYRAFVTTAYREEQAMDFVNTFEINADVDVVDKLNLSLYADVELYYFSEIRGNNEMWYQAMPKATYKILPTTKVSLAYNFIYDLYPDEILSNEEIDSSAPKSESGDIGLVGTHGSSSSSGGAFATDPIAADASLSNEFFLYIHELVSNVSHSFTDKTKGGLTYTFGRSVSNRDAKDSWENKVKAAVSQKLWKNASLDLAYEVRMLDYISALADNGIDFMRDYRNRFTFELSQQINKWFSMESHYRFQKTFSNADRRRHDPEERHELWIGGVLNF